MSCCGRQKHKTTCHSYLRAIKQEVFICTFTSCWLTKSRLHLESILTNLLRICLVTYLWYFGVLGFGAAHCRYQGPLVLNSPHFRTPGLACGRCQINPAFLIILARQGRGELRSIVLILYLSLMAVQFVWRYSP